MGSSWLDETDIPVDGVLPTPSVAMDDERYDRVDNGLEIEMLNENESIDCQLQTLTEVTVLKLYFDTHNWNRT